jgi:hypothetical protein
MTLERALAKDAPILHADMTTGGKPLEHMTGPTNIAARMEIKRGDVDAGFAEADIVVEHEFRTPMVHQATSNRTPRSRAQVPTDESSCGRRRRRRFWCAMRAPAFSISTRPRSA